MAAKIRKAIEELGLLSGVLYLLDRILQKLGGFAVIRRYVLVAQPVPERPLLGPRRGRSIEVRMVEPGDPALAAMPLSQAVLDYRYGQGALCFGAFQDGRMIGCQWLCLGPYNEDEVRSRFVPRPAGRAAWDFDIYVLPELRQGLAFMRLWDTANAYLRERDVVWSLSRISAFNALSLASHKRLGARRIGTATYLRAGRWQLMISSLRPRLHLSGGPQGVPELPLQVPGD